MIKFVNDYVGIVQEFFFRNVNRPLSMDVASQCLLGPSREAHFEAGLLNFVVLAQRPYRTFRIPLARYEMYNLALKIPLVQ